MSNEQTYKYFSSVEGKVVPRYGSAFYIGAKRTMDGWEWNTKEIARIPDSGYRLYIREYGKAVKYETLVSRTKADYDSYLKDLEKENAVFLKNIEKETEKNTGETPDTENETDTETPANKDNKSGRKKG